MDRVVSILQALVRKVTLASGAAMPAAHPESGDGKPKTGKASKAAAPNATAQTDRGNGGLEDGSTAHGRGRSDRQHSAHSTLHRSRATRAHRKLKRLKIRFNMYA